MHKEIERFFLYLDILAGNVEYEEKGTLVYHTLREI